MAVMRLRDCARSTRLGVPDQGFPELMRKLAARGLVEPHGDGYCVTAAGFDYIRENRTQIASL